MSLRSKIQQNLDEIRSAAYEPLEQSIPNRINAWEDSLGSNGDWSRCVSLIRKTGSSSGDTFSLSRSQVIEWMRSDIPLRQQLLLVLLWGYGVGKGRGRSAVAAIMSDPKLDRVLSEVDDDLGRGDGKSAFDRLKMVTKLGVSFLTKYLYFKTRSREELGDQYLLIFDNRAALSLIRHSMEEEDHWVTEIATVQRGDNWKHYDQYCQQLRSLASEFALEPDRLEYWLYSTADS